MTRTNRPLLALAAACTLSLAVMNFAMAAGPGEKVKDAIDPDCTVGKAARGAATKAVVGVRGNRCDAGETARDVLGVDGKKKKDGDGVLGGRASN